MHLFLVLWFRRTIFIFSNFFNIRSNNSWIISNNRNAFIEIFN